MAETTAQPVLGIIGGSGLYEIEGLTNAKWEQVTWELTVCHAVQVTSPGFGEPSDQVFTGELDGMKLCFLPRHGRGHVVPPSDLNFRANIDVLKRLGCTDILSLSAVGSLKEEHPPGSFVIIDQSFFGPGLVAHVSVADPTCSRLGDAVEEVLKTLNIPHHRGGTYLVMEGPQFSTRAESELYRSWNCNVIGMTNMPEAKLAREAEMCYCTVAMVTDYDCWHPAEEDANVEAIIKVLMGNAAKAREVVKLVAPKLKGHAGPCCKGCQRALDTAVITAPDKRSPEMLQKLEAVAGRVLSPK